MDIETQQKMTADHVAQAIRREAHRVGDEIVRQIVVGELNMSVEKTNLEYRMRQLGDKIGSPNTTYAQRDILHRELGELIELHKLASRHDEDAANARSSLLARIHLICSAAITLLIIVSGVSCSRPSARRPLKIADVLLVVHQLQQSEGMAVRGAPIELADRLYLLAGENGPNASENCASSANWQSIEHTNHCPGSIVSLKSDGTDFRVEYGFTRLDDQSRTNEDGYHPYGTLALSPLDHRLYGVTQTGGAPKMEPGEIGYGTLFAFDVVTKKLEKLHDFCSEFRCFDGENPMGKLAIDPYGDVFGCAHGGGVTSSGTVFEWSPSGAFRYSPIPGLCYGGLTYSGGLLHGTTWSGGNGVGVYFVVDPITLSVRTVDAFPTFQMNEHGTDNTPIQTPLALRDGRVFAVREFGGTSGTGVMAQLDPFRGIRILREFQDIPLEVTPRFSNATGGMINGDVAEGENGVIYGVAQYGGASGTGGVYEVAPNGSRFRLIWSFSDAAYPYGGVVVTKSGKVCGTTFDTNTIWCMTPPE